MVILVALILSIGYLQVFFVKAVEVLVVLLCQAKDNLVLFVEPVLSLIRHILPVRLAINEDGIDGDKEELTNHKAYA